jgi:hypothetical protein
MSTNVSMIKAASNLPLPPSSLVHGIEVLKEKYLIKQMSSWIDFQSFANSTTLRHLNVAEQMLEESSVSNLNSKDYFNFKLNSTENNIAEQCGN